MQDLETALLRDLAESLQHRRRDRLLAHEHGD
jgi:hypothetical protein